ncbi:hypothetical protein Ahy_A06g027970 [Arachis hypogaea]|uniref:Uncharacterized protein n=1 Tax=Arachis hypogaea TaxID=3818 RepID=A0A445CQ66_ARAHY|nr:hypothetical protein Ahy_A06g027970 [Arachis hypogaea]
MNGVKWVEKLFYRILISVFLDDVKYDSFVIGSDKDLQVLFHCCCQFRKGRTSELLAQLLDMVYSLGGLNQNYQPSAMPDCSSSMLLGASSSVPVVHLRQF